VVDFAYISGGRLFVRLSGEEARELESPFATSVVKRTASIARRNEWKRAGRGARFMMGLEGLSEQLDAKQPPALVLFTGLSRGRHATEICYSLASSGVTGLFTFSGGEEQRLFHGTDVAVSEPDCQPGGERIACVIGGKDGQSHIAVIGRDGLQEVTAGDAMDGAPCWVPGRARILFESRAFGYDRGGRVVDVAPATIQELDLDAGEVTARVEKPDMSCSDPRIGHDGTLYYLRRPVPRRERISIFRLALDALLFPWRMLMALFQYLNFFSLRYTGKPLVTAGSARAKRADIKRAAMIGNLSAAADAADEDEKLPDDWQLIALEEGGTERVIARGVLCFDVCHDGGVIWSNGRTILWRKPDGAEEELAKRLEVTRLVALAPMES
jgi:hypothetical protein